VELERSGFRDRFELVTRWAAEPLDLLRELRKFKPTVVHFSGRGTAGVAGHAIGPEPHLDVDIEPGHNGGDPRPGLFFQGPDGGPQLVSTEALEATLGAAGSSVKLIVLSACYSELNANALLRHISCVVGVSGAIADDAARSFAIGFYGGLGERESIAAAYAQGCAAISLQGLADHDRPKLAVRAGIDVGKLVLAADSVEAPASEGGTKSAGHSATSRHRPHPATPPQVDIGMASPHVRSKRDQTQPRHDPYVASPQTRATRMLASGVAVLGLGAALIVWRQNEHPNPVPDPPNMARFQAADVYLSVFAALPDDCRQLPVDENCAEWRHPESVPVTHVAAFDLDRKETTNDDFSAWLNTHTNDWSLEKDGVVTGRKNHLPLLATPACTDDLSILPGGRVEPRAGAAQRPVTCVTWYGAEKYCRAQGKRLPLEAEWELAAKGTAGRPFPWGADADYLDGVAYHLSGPRGVGASTKDVSPEGVFDLAGNVAEWVQSDRNTPDKRVVRGGSYLSDRACGLLGSRCARISVTNVGRNVGFRCARKVDKLSPAQERTQ
jgi:hypothetical protein